MARYLSKSRFGGGELCAGGCGNLTIPDSVYCEQCKDTYRSRRKPTRKPISDLETDVVARVLAEQLKGETELQDRIAKEGTGECGICGRPTLPGRIYCSQRCRGRASYYGSGEFEVNGVMDTFKGHIERCGISKRTARGRLERGWSLADAVSAPLQTTGPFEVDGIVDTFKGHAERHGIRWRTAIGRLERGWGRVEAVTIPLQKRGGNVSARKR